jgi:hypothetical protein
MPDATRRTLMRSASLAASAALLAPATLNRASGEEATDGGVFHIFAFQWKPDATEEQKERAHKEIATFQGQIAGLLETHAGPNLSPRGKGYTFGGIMRFKDAASLDAYTRHPAHLALLKWLVPLIDAIELDLRA